jgi:hypothetical protein
MFGKWQRVVVIVMAFVVLCAWPAMAAPLEFLTPAGGETFVGGSTQNIVYRSANNTGIVRLYYRLSNTGDWIKISDAKAGAIDYPWQVPTSLADIHTAQLKAVWVESDWADAKIINETVSKQFTIITPAINSPRDVQAKGLSDSQIILTWDSNSTHIDGFAIYRKINVNNDFAKVGTVGAGIRQFTDTGLSPNTTYHYSVRSYRGSKESADSKIVSTQTLAEGSSTGKTVLTFKLESREYFVNSEKKWMDAPLTMIKGRMVLPIKYVIDPLYGSSAWDNAKKQVTVSLGSNSVICWVGNGKATVNGVTKAIDAADASVAPVIMGGRLMLPARFVGESLGCTVNYNNVTKEMRITGP